MSQPSAASVSHLSSHPRFEKCRRIDDLQVQVISVLFAFQHLLQFFFNSLRRALCSLVILGLLPLIDLGGEHAGNCLRSRDGAVGVRKDLGSAPYRVLRHR